MARVRVVTADAVTAASPPADSRGALQTTAFLDRDSDPLHLHQYQFAPGAGFEIRDAATDYACYIWKGAVEVRDVLFTEGSSLMVEMGGSVAMSATEEGASLLVFNVTKRRSAKQAAGHVHLLPRERVPRRRDLGSVSRAGGGIHANSTCPTCEIWLHENDFHEPGYEVHLHSHSEDEIIFVTEGSIELGARTYGAGTAILITAGTRYGFKVGADCMSFINFRPCSPTFTSGDGTVTTDEGAFWRSSTGRPEYLELKHRAKKWEPVFAKNDATTNT